MKMKEMIMVCCVLFVACFPDSDPLEDAQVAQSEVQSDLASYYNLFEAEASARGLIIDLDDYDLESRISEINEEGVAGTCQFNSHSRNIVTIDLEFWKNANPVLREMVVFHELGHCVLNQGHREGENNQGACLSLMNSGTSGCQVYYNEENRNYYLNELFGFSEMVALRTANQDGEPINKR